MISFVNAKINIGLDILNRRPDGYHNLQTIFYPIGKKSATAESPLPFGDMIEITPTGVASIKPDYSINVKGYKINFYFEGNKVNCSHEKNLIVKGTQLYFEKLNDIGVDKFNGIRNLDIRLVKKLPDGAGLGGGSADASMLLTMLNDLFGKCFDETSLAQLALRLGADCPFFVYNRPMIGEGVGELLSDIDLSLTGYSLVVVKPPLYISTAEAFAGISPGVPEFDLHNLPNFPIERWKDIIKNDFESHLFISYPVLKDIKMELYRQGALYAQMSGSGSALYGIFKDEDRAQDCYGKFKREKESFYTSLIRLS